MVSGNVHKMRTYLVKYTYESREYEIIITAPSMQSAKRKFKKWNNGEIVKVIQLTKEKNEPSQRTRMDG